MTSLTNLKISTRFGILLAVLILGLAVAGFAAARLAHRELISSKVEELKAIVDTSIGIADSLDKQIQAGQLTKEQAIDALRERLLPMTFDHGEGYVFVLTMDGVAVAMPDPKLIGTNRLNARTTSGELMVRMQRDGVLKNNGTFVMTYLYPKPGQTAEVEKLAYAVQYKPWNMFFGTGVYLDSLETQFSSIWWSYVVLFAAVILVVAAAATLIALSIVRPLAKLQTGMHRLAEGDRSTDIAGVGRGDEIGRMAAAVQIFKNTMTKADLLAAEQEQAKAAAAAAEKAAMNRTADGFEAKVGDLVSTLSAGATDLEATARTMTSTATRANSQASAVAAAAERASVGAQTVAAAAEELTASINEISRQVAQSSRITGQAVANAQRTDFDRTSAGGRG